MTERTFKIFYQDLEQLKESLLLMGGLIESMLAEVRDCVIHRDANLANQIIARDRQLNQWEKDVDELAIQILALRQPAARDLRFVVAALKISTDLERVGDEIVNICERIFEIAELNSAIQSFDDLLLMLDLSGKLISRSLDSFVALDSQMAGHVLQDDQAVDDLHKKVIGDLLDLMKLNANLIVPAMKFISVSKYIERIADHATNVAEQVIFMVEGLDIRHSDVRAIP